MKKEYLESMADEVVYIPDNIRGVYEHKMKELLEDTFYEENRKEQKIFLSAVIVCKNEEDVIKNCLDSLILSEFDEILVVDTGSTDKTIAIVNEYMIKDKSVRLTHYCWCDDFSSARNFGIDNSKGNWIFFIDADEKLKKRNGRSIKEIISFYSRILGDCIGFSPVIISLPNNRLYKKPRIFCKNADYRYFGYVHEILRNSRNEYVFIPYITINIIIEHVGYTLDRIDNKIKRNMYLLNKNILHEPNNPLWYCYKLRDGEDILSIDEKVKLYNKVCLLCNSPIKENYYLYCCRWASIIMIQDFVEKKSINEAKAILLKLKNLEGSCKSDIFYLECIIKMKEIDLQLEEMEKQANCVRQIESFKASLINTEGYHIDEVIMKLDEMQHKMGIYIEYKDFLLNVGYIRKV